MGLATYFLEKRNKSTGNLYSPGLPGEVMSPDLEEEVYA